MPDPTPDPTPEITSETAPEITSETAPEILKERLRAVVAHDFAVPDGADPHAFALALLPRLGDPDPELRDDLIYGVLARWLRGGVFACEELRGLLERLLGDDHLFLEIGSRESDSVFMRSFSVLLVPQVLAAHRGADLEETDGPETDGPETGRQAPCFSAAEIERVRSAVVRYLREERDLRGYVEGKGWAHALAHGADALTGLMLTAETERAGVLEMLTLVRELAAGTTGYVHGEDERLTRPVVYAMLRDDVTEEDIVAWLAGVETLARRRRADAWPVGYRGLMNLKHTLGSLYFLLLRNPELPHQARAKAEIERVVEAIEGL